MSPPAVPEELFVRAALDFLQHKRYWATLWHLEAESGLQRRALPPALERLRRNCAAGEFALARRLLQEMAAPEPALREVARAAFLEGLYEGHGAEELCAQFNALRGLQDAALTQQLLRAMSGELPESWTPLHGRVELFEQLLALLAPALAAPRGYFPGLFAQLTLAPGTRALALTSSPEPLSAFLDCRGARAAFPPRAQCSAKKRKFDLFMSSQRRAERPGRPKPSREAGEPGRPRHRPSKSSSALPQAAEALDRGPGAGPAHKRACSSGIARRPLIEDFFLNDSTATLDREANEYYPVGPFVELCTLAEQAAPRAAAFSPDGEFLAVALRAGQVSLFGLQAALEGRGRAPEPTAATSFAGCELAGPLRWAPNSQLLAVCAADKTLLLAARTDALAKVS